MSDCEYLDKPTEEALTEKKRTDWESLCRRFPPVQYSVNDRNSYYPLAKCPCGEFKEKPSE